MSLLHAKHEKFFNRCLTALPSGAASEDSNKLAIIFFCLQGLQLLKKLNFSKEECQYHENYIWDSFYIEKESYATYRSTSYFSNAGEEYDYGNISACFFALASLVTLRSDLKRLNRTKIIKYLQKCQVNDGPDKGGFVPFFNEYGFGEPDLRQCYMALLIRKLLLSRGDVQEDIDLESLQKFILSRLSLNGGFSSRVLDEAHLGFTFCAIASLKLLGYPVKDLANTRNWLLHRQISYPESLFSDIDYDYFKDSDTGGFNGRENKLGDTCYSWWCSGSLYLMNPKSISLLDIPQAENFLLNCTQNTILGGFSSTSEATPDPMHSCLALASLSLWDYEKYNLDEIEPAFVMSKKQLDSYTLPK
ncbi:CDC43 [Candida margitis]|uniref:CDC43 n=1 Tax=Candida margitis TaxID=1775924 RepID=UPI0022271E5F|nr:CDC43 [Candida margitis]KAI5968295.1 CDC43 [Candida margitis]